MLTTLHRGAPAVALLLVLTACGGGEGTGGTEAAAVEASGTAAPAAGSPSTGSPSTGTPTAGGPTGTAAIAGIALYSGEDPDHRIALEADPNCLELNPDPVYTERVVVDDEGHLANVFVYLSAGVEGDYPPPAEAVVLDQRGCRYHPHVLGLQVGQPLVVRNSDETLHNVHALPVDNPSFNEGQPFADMEMTRTFSEPEVMVPFKCDVHPWMSAYAGVVGHPFFAVSGADGRFDLEGLPAGTYTVEAWHEELGSARREVTVADGERAEITFDFTPGQGDAAAD